MSFRAPFCHKIVQTVTQILTKCAEKEVPRNENIAQEKIKHLHSNHINFFFSSSSSF